MKLEQIFELWSEDSVINPMDLSSESLKIPKLHHKYYEIFCNEKLLLKKYESELKVLKLEKYEFYTQGPSKDTEEKGWKLPSIGRILKSDVQTYVDADKDIIALTLKVAVQSEKVSLLDSIIKSFKDRNFTIKNSIDFTRFQSGA
jgi:hypothetical protein